MLSWGAVEPAKISTPPTRSGPAPTVLIVEDEPMTAMMVERAVSQRGYDVAGPFATDGEALGAIRMGGLCAALLDVSLQDGATSAPVAAALAAAGIPFAFVTGYGPETGAVAASFPDRLVIPKPVDAETVGLILEELVREAD